MGLVRSGLPRRNPLMLKSSSSLGQWIPIPPPIKRKSARSSGVALLNLGYHERGTDRLRPSFNSIRIDVSSILTDTAFGASILFSEKLFPPNDDDIFILSDYLFDISQFFRTHIVRFGQDYTVLYPELCSLFGFLDVHVNGLIRGPIFICEKKYRKPLCRKIVGTQ